MKSKILVVEDNTEMRNNISEILEISNYEVYTAEDGLKGIQAVKEFNPDLIISDIMMPNLDGLGMLKILSQDDALSCIPLIFLTAKTEKDDFRKGMNLGAEDYLLKPFESKDLLEVIEIKLKKYQKINLASKGKTLKGVFNEVALLKNQRVIELLNSTEVSFLGKGSVIWQNEANINHIYYIESGVGKEYIDEIAGKDLIINLYKGNCFMGIDKLFQSNYSSNLQIIAEAKLKVLPKSIFEEIIESENLMVSYHEYTNYLIHNLTQRLAVNAYGNVREKVSFHLIQLYEIFKKEPINLTREDMAFYCGMAKETLIRMLSELKDDKLIKLDHLGIQILNPVKLSAEY